MQEAIPLCLMNCLETCLKSEGVLELQGQLNGDPSDYSVMRLTPLKGRLEDLRSEFRNLQNEVSSLHHNRFHPVTKQMSQLNNSLKDAASRVDQARSHTISQCTRGPVTRKDSRDFEILEEGSQLVREEFNSKRGPLDRDTLDTIGIYCAITDLEMRQHQKFKEPASRMTDQWFRHASQFAY